ncbi:PREDICTED: histone-lysine N-methyltransferase SUV39H2 [Vollenhovia emeryi]|uniref:histone-lysine N-methyltransferase SUV39H2 n=1 Tax=Vollenhovia emeryi TaxID=411798 RepID=UPI0005F3B0EE|nr:PREDICTED: histone-lysine N-methyltransferase SUV39H2 [Vollenhovia emeryi]
MFGIADAAACGSSGESADKPGSVASKTPAVRQKRHLSPGSTDAPSCAKMPRNLDREGRKNIPHRLDGRHTLRSSSSSSSLASSSLSSLASSSSSSSSSSSIFTSPSSLSLFSSKRLRPQPILITQQVLKVFESSSRTLRSRSTGARYPGSDGRQSDYEESSSDGMLSARGDAMNPRLDCELKEVRVMLYDIMRNDKYRKLTAAVPDKPSPVSSKNIKLWEVERILQKREQKRQPFYLVKWKGWGVEYNTWEPLQNLINCRDLLCEFDNEQQELIDRFKETTNYYPDSCDVAIFLARNKKMSIVDATSAATAAVAEGGVYAEIRRFLKSRSAKLETKIKRQILRMLLIELRRDQLESLQDWENEMNSITKGKPTILVENLVDLESAPQDFFYIDSYLPGAGVLIPDDPPIGCECDGECGTAGNKVGCCFAQNGATSLAYTSARRVRVPLGTPIYECNKRCACDASTCPNRVVQLGTGTQLCIFRTDNERGWGVRTRRAIKKGTFVIQYVGEVIRNEEAEKRGRQYNLTGRTYLFDLDYNETDGQCPYTVDAAMYGNVSHFINHSCDPNLAVYAIWINCLDPNLPGLALFAIKDIKQNEELTFDYLCQTPRDNAKGQQPLDNKPEDSNASSKNRMLCKCGAATCRRYLF